MIHTLGDRQQEILRQLLRCKAGLTIDELESLVGVTRTAVVQHLATLEQAGYVAPGALRSTGGRPVRVFALTAQGIDLFPKQYSWFAALLLGVLQTEFGPAQTEAVLAQVAEKVAAGFQHRLAGLDERARAAEVVEILNELAFDASLHAAKPSRPEIVAANCVYHHLAAEFPQVCRFDIALLAELTGQPVEQRECIVRGGNVCRFQLGNPTAKEKGADHGRNKQPGKRS